MTQPMIYSYRRISSKKQELGRGMDMQDDTETLKRLEIELKLPVSERRLDDFSKSAFHGRNVKDGDLGWFLEAVREGDVHKGSCLVVYSLDRFSRQRIEKAIHDFTSILREGVMIYSILERTLFGDPNKSNEINASEQNLANMVFARAYNESITKSNRAKDRMALAVRDFKEGKRKDGRVIAIKVVGNDVWWIDNSDGTIRKRKGTTNDGGSSSYFELARAILLKRIEGWSVYRIMNWLNDTTRKHYLPSPTNRSDKKESRFGLWTRDMVNRISESRESKVPGSNVRARPILGEKLIGDEVLEGYYPPLLTTSEYSQLMRMIKTRARPKSRSKQGESLFSGINVFCSGCGDRVTRTMETGGILNYRCSNANCKKKWSKRGSELEKAILDSCVDKVWKPRKIITQSDQVKTIEGELIRVREELEDIKELLVGKNSRTFAERVFSLEDEENALLNELEKARIAEESVFAQDTKMLSERWSDVTTKVLDFNNDLGRIKFRDLIHDSCERIDIGRPGDADRYRIAVLIKFIDGEWRHILLGRREILSVDGSDLYKLKEDALKRLVGIEAAFNIYRPTPDIDEWLENEFSDFTQS
ncbi:recombinase family protein [Vibrio furnissii]|uniref:recombinase family protein n=1 Tax=Vibrio furnissii TaxID=29494 RepID=UPI003D7EB5A5